LEEIASLQLHDKCPQGVSTLPQSHTVGVGTQVTFYWGGGLRRR